MSETKITVTKNGPYLVTGEIELVDANGKTIPANKGTIALCRCGASTKKPFYDGTYSKIGFEAAEDAVPQSEE
jgi:3-phenylpropionate/trans-cinnamate dioxygenase ferredoxin subunit